MMQPIQLPLMPPAQHASWQGLIELAQRVPEGWSLAGGQMVQLHCFERGATPSRATDDVDAVLDVRAHPDALRDVTGHLLQLGFNSDKAASINGLNHRWRRGNATIDVLIPRHLGERAASRGDVHGSPGLETPGAQFIIDRTKSIPVALGSQHALVNRPTLLGALIAKASALKIVGADPERHLRDFATLAVLAKPSDFRSSVPLRTTERDRLANAIGVLRAQYPSIIAVSGSAEALEWIARETSKGKSPKASAPVVSRLQGRVSAGQSEGGQFARVARSEPDISLE